MNMERAAAHSIVTMDLGGDEAALAARRKRNSMRAGSQQELAIQLAARDVRPPPRATMNQAVRPHAVPQVVTRGPPPRSTRPSPVRKAAASTRRVPVTTPAATPSATALSTLVYELRTELARVARERDALRTEQQLWEKERERFFKRISSNAALAAQGMDVHGNYDEEDPEKHAARVHRVARLMLQRWQRSSQRKGLAGWSAHVSLRVKTRRLVNHVVVTWRRARLVRGLRVLKDRVREENARVAHCAFILERAGKRWNSIMMGAAFRQLSEVVRAARQRAAHLRNGVAVRLRIALRQGMMRTTESCFLKWRALAASETIAEVSTAHKAQTERLVSNVVSNLECIRARQTNGYGDVTAAQSGMAAILDEHQRSIERIGRLQDAVAGVDVIEAERVRRLLELELHRSHGLMWVFAWGCGVEVPGWKQ